MKPWLKWAGGKRQLLPELLKSLPEDFFENRANSHYYEPFVGGGALFFELRSRGWSGPATLGDMNSLLVRSYMGIKHDVEMVIESLKAWGPADKEEFLAARSKLPDDRWLDEGVASWMIYLNKCCFNGLWRVNGAGYFNVPFGKWNKPPTICDEETLRSASKALECTKLLAADFERVVKSAESGDLVYMDPPYVPVSKTSDFTSYTRDGFTIDDQKRLRDCALKLKERGVYVVLSNADVPVVREMYEGFNIRRVEARRSINSKGGKRGAVGEVIIT